MTSTRTDHSNINLLYSGGSGGYLLLHLLLLSRKYIAAFNENNNIDDIIKSQWQIPILHEWKTKETVPNNHLTHSMCTDLKKVYFFCNPEEGVEDRWIGDSNSINVCIYTDYQSQEKLAYYKKAKWYNPDMGSQFAQYAQLLREWRQHYTNIKARTWPKCTSFRHINQLPLPIQSEILANPYTTKFVEYTKLKEFNNCTVYGPIFRFLENAEVTIKLQDLINSNGEELLKIGLTSVTPPQLELISTWKKLHPSWLLRDIGINQ